MNDVNAVDAFPDAYATLPAHCPHSDRQGLLCLVCGLQTIAAVRAQLAETQQEREVVALLVETLEREREDARLRAYRMTRIFEPSMDGYNGAVATYEAAFGKEPPSDPILTRLEAAERLLRDGLALFDGMTEPVPPVCWTVWLKKVRAYLAAGATA